MSNIHFHILVRNLIESPNFYAVKLFPATAYSEVLLQHMAKIFRELPKVASTPSGSGQNTISCQLFLDKLPSEFERRDFIEIAASLGIPQSTAERNVKKWCDEGLLSHLEQGKYRKN